MLKYLYFYFLWIWYFPFRKIIFHILDEIRLMHQISHPWIFKAFDIRFCNASLHIAYWCGYPVRHSAIPLGPTFVFLRAVTHPQYPALERKALKLNRLCSFMLNYFLPSKYSLYSTSQGNLVFPRYCSPILNIDDLLKEFNHWKNLTTESFAVS